MVRRFTTASYVIFAFLAIGIIAWFLQDPMARIIPVVVFGGIYLLYKFPPARMRGLSRYAAPPRAKTKKRPIRFRVIPGSKPGPDDEPRRYH